MKRKSTDFYINSLPTVWGGQTKRKSTDFLLLAHPLLSNLRGEKMNQSIFNVKNLLLAILFIAIGTTSYFSADTDWVTNVNTQTIETLDEKKETVVALTALAGTTSTAITLIPGDVGGPVAQNIADIADYLLIVFAGIWLQKYFLSVTPLVALQWLIPLACGALLLNLAIKSDRLKRLGMRVFLMGIMIFTIIPASVGISNKIEENYQSSIEQTFEQAESVNKEATQDKNLFEQMTTAVTDLMAKFEQSLGNMIDSTAVLIITTCVGPVLVFFFGIWATNLIMGLNYDIKMPRIGAFRRIAK